MSHIPVMLNEVLETLAPESGKVYIDGTFGVGGYTKAILDTSECTVIAIDRDPSAIERALELQKTYDRRLKPWHGTFSLMQKAAQYHGFSKVDGVVLDIGVSSVQIDQAERGFSFQKDGPLDMRMDNGAGQTAEEFINTVDEVELANIIWKYGEDRNSRKIASAIIKERPFTRTSELADAIRNATPPAQRHGKTDPSTKTFQAIRIHINDELGELERALAAAENILKPNGRLVVVTFHSLEDRIVKNFLIEKSEEKSVSRYQPLVADQTVKTFKLTKRQAIKVSKDEANDNPRARSAKLRFAIRTEGEVAA